MKTTIKTGLSTVMAVAMFATSFVTAPASAMPLPKAGVSQTSDVEPVQYRRRHHGGRGWHNGHRGSRYHRHGYRRHSDGWWYPLAAFGLGAAIGGAISSDRDAEGSHVSWCANRYRSYRAYDNTFQPNDGPRKACISPYSR